MTPDIFEVEANKVIFEADVFQTSSPEPEPRPRARGWRVWMSAAAVSASVAVAATGTFQVTRPRHECPEAARLKTHLEFAYSSGAPRLTAAQKARAFGLAKRTNPRPHPEEGFEEVDFV